MRLLGVQYAENLERSIISYTLLEAKGYGLAYRGCHHVVAALDGGAAVVDMEKSKNMLVVRVRGYSDAGKASDMLMSVLAQNEQEVRGDVQLTLF